MEEMLFSSGFTPHPFEQGFVNAEAGPEKRIFHSPAWSELRVRFPLVFGQW